ncbi:MAG TPA: lanthionine synthetase C family protein [Vicinamibacterales bacterium]|nr:lanthionine synthetase C family protein [Vicinamibacterales bacterium]
MAWQAVIEQPARGTVLDGVRRLAEHSTRLSNGSSSILVLSDLALLCCYLRVADGRSQWSARAVEYLNMAVGELAEKGLRAPWLFGGLAGVGWTIQHVMDMTRRAGDPLQSDADELEEIDAVLIHYLEQTNWSGSFDLINGLVGIGVYFLERPDRDLSRRAVSLIVRHLEKMSEAHPEGIAWLSPPRENHGERSTAHYNLGVAHGVPGVIAFLGLVHQRNVENEIATRLLHGALAWLRSSERPASAETRFGSWVEPGGYQPESRVGWCYGDLGIGLVVLNTSLRANDHGSHAWALGLLERCLEWPVDHYSVRDSALCHGALGVAHIFNRVYQSTHDLRFRQAANAWYERSIALRRPGVGIDGFFQYRTDSDPPYHSDTTFLNGTVGIGLALLAGASDFEPGWDRLLLVGS